MAEFNDTHTRPRTTPPQHREDAALRPDGTTRTQSYLSNLSVETSIGAPPNRHVLCGAEGICAVYFVAQRSLCKDSSVDNMEFSMLRVR